MIFHFLQETLGESLLTNLFRYITFRSVVSAFFSFAFVLFFMPRLIRWLKKAAVGQIIRDDGPQAHLSKTGTPTMGGVLIVWSVTISSLLFCRLDHVGVWISVLAFVAAGSLGFIDDYLKLSKKNSKGLSSKFKMIGLSIVSVGVCYVAIRFELIEAKVLVPFFKDFSIHLGSLFYVWAFLVIVGCSNAVNLTDGLDGLAIVPVMTTAFVLMVIAYVSGHALFSEYLQLASIKGAGELSIIMAAVIGSGLGFLWYNSHPAQIFMGDVGSLSLGALLGTMALLIHQELVLFMAGFLFVIEAGSVILQVGYYKSSRKRVFRMAPLHHHFELGGWPESKVIVRFWILSIIFALIALSTLKIR